MTYYIAVFDIGTTAIKGVLIDEQAVITGESSVFLQTHYGDNGEIEQYPADWWHGLKQIAAYWWSELLLEPKQVSSITFSGQMEDVIPMSRKNLYEKAILYSDTRAANEAALINSTFPSIPKQLGNTIRSSTPLAKMLWLQKREPHFIRERRALCSVPKMLLSIISRVLLSLIQRLRRRQE